MLELGLSLLQVVPTLGVDWLNQQSGPMSDSTELLGANSLAGLSEAAGKRKSEENHKDQILIKNKKNIRR